MSSTDVDNYAKKVLFVLSELVDKLTLRKQIRMQFFKHNKSINEWSVFAKLGATQSL